MKAKVYVTLKKGVHDPQGEAVRGTLSHMGFDSIEGVRIGKYIELDLNSGSKDAAGKEVETMCRKLLSNPVIESYHYTVEDE